MLELRSIDQHYGSSQALRNLSLVAHPGKVTAVLGRNGTGKTTLMRTVMGLVKPTSGTILWEGRDITGLATEERVARGFGYVPQGREIFPRLSVEENLAVGMAHLPAREARKIPGRLYELFPVLQEMRSRRGGDLSGGQQQQLAIARALAGRPKVLLLDEPTEGIQPSIIKAIGQVLSHLSREEGMAVVLVEQYYDFAEGLADHYVVLSRGEVVDSGEGRHMKDKDVRSLIAV